MTVAALWPILEGSGTAVGLQDWLPPASSPPTATAAAHQRQPLRLAVDLSIWICEAQTSTVLRNFHTDPAVFLAYQRTVALLRLGIQLIAVIEGDRRGTDTAGAGAGGDGTTGTTRRRGNAGAFAAACRNCERMLSLLGVPVVRATHEGEALCALLNQRDVVDGVISNDGDCLLFGAATLFTDFSLDNLHRGAVKRYDASNLQAASSATEDPGDGAPGNGNAATFAATNQHITLTRDDLIAFAIICGSDIAGGGIPTMGAKKAIKFIEMCQKSRASTRNALEVLRLWDADARLRAATTMAAAATLASAAHHNDDDDENDDNPAAAAAASAKQRCCSICLHVGDKRTHEKSGCTECGSSEGCYPVSVEERYKGSIKEKALGMTPTFASQPSIQAYRNPNGNVIPRTTMGATLRVSSDLPMQRPKYQEALRSSLLFKGNSSSTSQEYLRQTMPKLLARLYILEKAKSTLPENRYVSSSSNISDDMPTPRKIIGRQTKNGRATYLIEWIIGRKEEDALIFVTSEWQSIVDSKMSTLVDAFRRAEQTARNEESRRAMFGQGRGRGGGGGRGAGGVRGSSNRAGAKRRALVQNGGGGRKGGGGKRERAFTKSTSAAAPRAHDDTSNVSRHSTHEADKPTAVGDDTTNITKFIMRENHFRAEEEGKRGEKNDSINAGDANADSDCSDLSFDDFEENVDRGTFIDIESSVGNRNNSVSGRADQGYAASMPINAHHAHDHAHAGGAYETPNQYHRGNLANPQACFKPFDSEERNVEDNSELKLAPEQEEEIGAHAAASAAYRPVLETPNVYYYGQLANPREPSPKEQEPEVDDEDRLRYSHHDTKTGFKTPMT